ncbi:MAG: ABC transporter ATP-binding protein [Syntrophobacteraceae bacterium CG2_30_61_12]|nr:MAG: ABC transporter ATP-binding protein [Syntrophobacteraceae bacterium CG2_30_61_12]PIU32721.1 MAG: ABC transporter ATP-binding protein [Syntrophobacteraceae bacterium CG07_land_8_20_14_0_80_61_8]
MKILEVNNLSKDFGGLRAVDNLSLAMEQGEILGLIGPNGAGKSTAFNCIAGVYPPTEGTIRFCEERINNRKPWDLCKQGLARTFQIVKPFSSKTVLYNVMVGSFANTDRKSTARDKALDVLDFLHLADKRDLPAGSMTIADRKRLEIGRALATEPKLILLDEVMAGLRPTEVDEMVDIIRKVRDSGISVFLIEHIMRAIMALSDRLAVIHFGKKIAEGAPKDVAADENVIKAYLGDEYVVS